jgi:tRNA pseudouridine13 synthase
MNHHGRRKQGSHVPEERFVSEQKLGIVERTSPIDFGWSGDMRKR